MQVRLEGANNTQIGFSNGIAVVGVKDGITEVKIPEKFNDLDIVSVSSDIFNSTLKTLDISKRVTHIDTQLVSNAVSLQEIRVAEENTAYASVDGVLFTKDLKEILCYPAARTDESFTLPKETEKYDEKETFVCEKLKDIHVEEGNSKYSSYDGCIYNKEKTLLLTIPEAKTEVKVPGTVVLDNTTFDSRSNITKIELEEGITTVMPYVFNYCTGIKELYLPDSLESIEADAFNGVNLKQVTVYGNRGTYAEEFAKKNGCTFVADTSDYKKGDVDLDGNVAIGDVRVVLRSICQKIELNEMQELAADVEQIRAAGKKAYYICPTVFRKQTSDFYLEKREALLPIPLNGLVVKSFDALAFVKQYWNTPELIADQNMYTYNSLAIGMLRDEQISRMTAPFELNRKELRNRSNGDSEMVLYGYLPLMTSAQCVHANTGRCDKRPQITYLKDRYGKYFPVKNNCMDCYNTVYNTTPLLLFASEPELLTAGFSYFRLAFTVEREKEVRRILDVYEAVVSEQRAKLSEVYDGDYTNGHYKRGVE